MAFAIRSNERQHSPSGRRAGRVAQRHEIVGTPLRHEACVGLAHFVERLEQVEHGRRQPQFGAGPP